MCTDYLSLIPICKGNIYVLIQCFFDFERQGVKKVIFHNKPAFLEQATLAQLGWQAVQAVPLQLQLSELGELTNFLWEGGDAVLPQTQSPQLHTFKQLFWQYVHLVPSDMQMLQVLKRSYFYGNH